MKFGATAIGTMLAISSASLSAVPAPSSSAVALAEAMIGPVDSARTATVAAGLAKNILGVQLAYRGPGCEPALAACRAAAEEVAREAAPVVAAEARNGQVKRMAMIFDATMDAGAMKDSIDFLKTASGRQFATAMMRGSDIRTLPADVLARLAEMSIMPRSETRLSTLAEQFYDRTRNLPRQTRSMAPPPPMPSRVPLAPSPRP